MQTLSTTHCHGGRLVRCSHASAATGTEMTFSLFLPSTLEVSRVGTLFWLSGLTCTDQNFAAKCGAAAFPAAQACGVAVCMPDTSPRGADVPTEGDDWDFGTGAGFYVDATAEAWKAHYNMHTYVTKELPALLEAEFKLPASACRSVSGHSMGGTLSVRRRGAPRLPLHSR